jgi:hypothetical protein
LGGSGWESLEILFSISEISAICGQKSERFSNPSSKPNSQTDALECVPAPTVAAIEQSDIAEQTDI